jgi:hypothetical protein
MKLSELLILLFIGFLCGEIGVRLLYDSNYELFTQTISRCLYILAEMFRKMWSALITWEDQCKLKNQMALHQEWLDSLPKDLREQLEEQEFFVVQYLYDRAHQKNQNEHIIIVRQSLALLRQYWSGITPIKNPDHTIDTVKTIPGTNHNISQLPINVRDIFSLIVSELGEIFSFYQLTLFVAAYRHKQFHIEFDSNLHETSQSFCLSLKDGDVICVPFSVNWEPGEFQRLRIISLHIATLLIMQPSSAADAPLVQTYLESRKSLDVSFYSLRPVLCMTLSKHAVDILIEFIITGVKNDLCIRWPMIANSNVL